MPPINTGTRQQHLESGSQAESLALEFLQEKGFTLLERNYRSRYGEIDLIMSLNRTIVFVEVRYRSNIGFGTPAETITREKQRKLSMTAEQYLQKHKKFEKLNCRFDVVAITGNFKTGTNRSNLDWIPNAFTV